MNPRPKKIVIIGNVNSGKTWLWQSYFNQRLPETYIQTIFDNHSTSIRFNGKDNPVTLFDTCGEEDYSNLRKIIYPGTDAIIFCVGIDNPAALDKFAIENWSQELKKHCKGIPVVLVGTKKDVRDNVDELIKLSEIKQKLLKSKDLATIAKKIKASETIECSAKTGEGLTAVFHSVIKLTIKTNKLVPFK